ncbi:ALP1-like protein isoform X1 [Tanacetum coccineum]
MARHLFNQKVTVVTDHDPFFRSNMDCAGRQGISGLIKCMLRLSQDSGLLSFSRRIGKQVVHSDVSGDIKAVTPVLRWVCDGWSLCKSVTAVLSFLSREFIERLFGVVLYERTSRTALDHFCQAVMKIYGPEFLRKPTVTDIEKLYLHHEEKHWFPGMLGSLDCTDWKWFGFPYAFKAHYVRRDHGPNPFILLEVVASQDLWIWHAFFGVAGSNNDINILYQSPLFNDLKTGRAPEIPFVANGVTYQSGYYLVDGIYPELALLIKMIPQPADDDHKRILYSKSRNRQGKTWNERLVF